MLAKVAVIWKLVWSWRIHFQGGSLTWLASSAGCWWEASVPSNVGFSTGLLGCLHNLLPTSPRAQELRALPPVIQENKAEAAVPFMAGFRSHIPSLLQYPIGHKASPLRCRGPRTWTPGAKDHWWPSWGLAIKAANAMGYHCPLYKPPTLFHSLFVKIQERPLEWIWGIRPDIHIPDYLMGCL